MKKSTLIITGSVLCVLCIIAIITGELNSEGLISDSQNDILGVLTGLTVGLFIIGKIAEDNEKFTGKDL